MYIAHKTGDEREQPLKAHLSAVAESCRTVGLGIGLPITFYLVGLLHDMGKYSREFQDYIRKALPALRGTVNHSAAGGRWVEQCNPMTGVDGLLSELMVAAICGHHSGLPDCLDLNGDLPLRNRLTPRKPPDWDEVFARFFSDCLEKGEWDRLFAQARGEWQLHKKVLVDIAKKAGASANALYAFLLGMTQRFLESALVDADRYDAYLFEAGLSPSPEVDVAPLWEQMADNLEKQMQDFAQMPDRNAIEIARGEIADACLAFAQRVPGVYRLYVPTGGGKTLSSVRYALACARRWKMRRIFYIAPYKSILTQNAGVLGKTLKAGDALLEHHGDAVVPEGEEGGEDDGRARHQLLTERWNAPMILTSAVQFLNTLFSGKSASVRRFHQLAGSVILLDEVQSIPIKCLHLLNGALDYLAGVCGCSVVLCTATQPNLDDREIPLLLGPNAQMVEGVEEIFEKFRRVDVIDETRQEHTADTFAQRLEQQLEEADSILAVVNTKAAAQALYEALCRRREEGEERSDYLLSNWLCSQHRQDKLDVLCKQLSANERPGLHQKIICVSTQLIEAGVDISFDCVFRSLAGLDSIAQAAGRCNRHGKGGRGKVFIVKYGAERLGPLPDIWRAQEACIPILEQVARKIARGEADGGTYLAPATIHAYYREYYTRQDGQLNYPVSAKKSDCLLDVELFDLLSANRAGEEVWKDRREGEGITVPAHHAYHTAGRLFEAIEDRGGIDVLVPYGKGKELIDWFANCPDIRQLPAKLREAQRYLVHISDYEKNLLTEKQALEYRPEAGVWTLDERFYDDELGLQKEPGELSLLNF